MIVYLKDEVRTKIMIAETGNSLRSFSEKINISHCYLSQIINKKRNPSPKVANKIAQGLGSKIDDIFLIKTVDETKQKVGD